jgi:TraM recognition site of TraD and TraG
MRCARHRLMIDEAESMITVDTARLVDRTGKFGLYLDAIVQRLGQLRAKGDFISDALLTNCSTVVAFGGLEPQSARYMAEHLFAGFVDLEEWKHKSARPTAVGQDKTTIKSSSHADHSAEHHASSETRSRGCCRLASRSTLFFSVRST